MNTSWCLNGYFAPNSSSTPSTDIRTFISGYFSNTLVGGYYTDSYTDLSLTGGNTYTVLLAYGSTLTTLTSNYNITITEAPCFVSGTLICTEHGYVAVENLRAGLDRVITGPGDTAPIRWIGHRTIDCRRHPRHADVWPVCVQAGSFGDG